MALKTRAQINALAEVIANEAAQGGNTKTRIANILKDIADSSFNKSDEPSPGGGGASNIQAETLAYYNAVIAAGGKIGAKTLYSIDNFIARGKSFGWFSKATELWIPCGDFAASKVKIVSATNWTFNELVANDYSEDTGYAIDSENFSKYIATGFIPSAH